MDDAGLLEFLELVDSGQQEIRCEVSFLFVVEYIHERSPGVCVLTDLGKRKLADLRALRRVQGSIALETFVKRKKW